MWGWAEGSLQYVCSCCCGLVAHARQGPNPTQLKAPPDAHTPPQTLLLTGLCLACLLAVCLVLLRVAARLALGLLLLLGPLLLCLGLSLCLPPHAAPKGTSPRLAGVLGLRRHVVF